MKYVFTGINMILVVAIAYFCIDIMYKNIMAKSFMLPEKHSSGRILKNISQKPWERTSNKNQFDIIVKRNLFKVEVEEKEKTSENHKIEEKEPEKLKPTNLNLVLWGTVTGEGVVYAVIEDKKLRQQALYEVGDSIQGAELKKIFRHEVILSFQGKDQILEMETDNKNVPKIRIPMGKINGNSLPGNKLPGKGATGDEEPSNTIFQEESSNDINTLMKQVKIRPHFTEGEADGLMVYGIRPNSVFKQLGLKNGDIIKDINGMAIVSPEDVSSFYNEISEAENAKITLLRRGKIEELNFHVKDGEYLITDFPEDIEKTKEMIDNVV